MLQRKPVFTANSLMNGDFASEFESFLSDSMPARKEFIGLSNSILESVSFNTSEDRYYLDNTAKEVAEYQGESSQSSADSEESGQETDPSDNLDDGSGAGASNGDATFELIKHNGKTKVVYRYPRKNIEKVAQNLEQYADLIPDDGHVIITLVPFPGLGRRFGNCPDVYKGWKSNRLDILNELTSDKIICVDTLRALEPHLLDGENLFLYGNHQWNVHGAYYVYCEMIRAQGLSHTPYDEYNYKVNRPQNPEYKKLDTYELLYPLAPAKNYRVTAIDHKKEIPFMKYSAPVTGAYLYGYVKPWKTVVTGFHSGRNALVIGDCFDLPLTPFLLPYYDEVHKTDVRYSIFQKEALGTSVADMIKRNSIDDIYLIYSEANDINSKTLLGAIVDNLY